MNSLSEGPLSFVVSIINNFKKNNENESVVGGGLGGSAPLGGGSASERAHLTAHSAKVAW